MLLFLLLGMAGCTGPSIEETSPAIDSSNFQDGNGTATAKPVEQFAILEEKSIRITNCSGILTLNHLPTPLVDAKPPGSWDGNGEPTVEVRLELHVCQRVSVGPFERGPVGLAIEVHDNQLAPGSCEAIGDFLTSETLVRMLVSDSDISAYLQTEFGMSSGTFAYDVTMSTPETMGISLNVDGSESELSVLKRSLGNGEAVVNDAFRFYWANEYGGINLMDFMAETHTQSLHPPAVTGTLNAPFLAAESVGNPYVGYGQPFTSSNAEGTVTRFGDMECQNPL